MADEDLTARQRLDNADAQLTGLQDSPDCPDHEAFDSAVAAARSAINSARAMLIQEAGT